VSEQCFTSPPTQYRLYGSRFLQVKRPNQQYQSTEGDAIKEKEIFLCRFLVQDDLYKFTEHVWPALGNT